MLCLARMRTIHRVSLCVSINLKNITQCFPVWPRVFKHQNPEVGHNRHRTHHTFKSFFWKDFFLLYSDLKITWDGETKQQALVHQTDLIATTKDLVENLDIFYKTDSGKDEGQKKEYVKKKCAHVLSRWSRGRTNDVHTIFPCLLFAVMRREA